MYQSDVNRVYLDGNISNNNGQQYVPSKIKTNKISDAKHLPTVATYNLRSFLPKAGNLVTDMLERQIDCGFLQEIWEQSDNIEHKNEVEKMLEINGLKYISCPRPKNSKGVSYGGVANWHERSALQSVAIQAVDWQRR